MIQTILIVDDESDLAATCQRLLNRCGWSVTIATSRQEALAILARPPQPALAIVDQQLPDGDGFDVLRAALSAGTPVIMVTGYGTATTRRLALEEGAAGFLAKPFASKELLDLVHRIAGDASGSATGVIRPPAPNTPRPGIHC